MFKGEYLNGKKWNVKGYNNDGKVDYELKEGNGKGKEYNYDGKLIFEGEYLNGKRNGKGKEYNYDGKLIFEGEYKSDKIWNGKGYDQNNNLLYEVKDGMGKYIIVVLNLNIKVVLGRY